MTGKTGKTDGEELRTYIFIYIAEPKEVYSLTRKGVLGTVLKRIGTDQ